MSLSHNILCFGHRRAIPQINATIKRGIPKTPPKTISIPRPTSMQRVAAAVPGSIDMKYVVYVQKCMME